MPRCGADLRPRGVEGRTMGSLERRLGRLEARTGAKMPTRPRRLTTLDEIHALEREIENIEAEMRAAGATEEEIRASRVEPNDFLDLEALDTEIRRIEAGEE